MSLNVHSGYQKPIRWGKLKTSKNKRKLKTKPPKITVWDFECLRKSQDKSNDYSGSLCKKKKQCHKNKDRKFFIRILKVERRM